MEDLILGGMHNAIKTYIISLTNFTPENLIKNLKKALESQLVIETWISIDNKRQKTGHKCDWPYLISYPGMCMFALDLSFIY